MINFDLDISVPTVWLLLAGLAVWALAVVALLWARYAPARRPRGPSVVECFECQTVRLGPIEDVAAVRVFHVRGVASATAAECMPTIPQKGAAHPGSRLLLAHDPKGIWEPARRRWRVEVVYTFARDPAGGGGVA